MRGFTLVELMVAVSIIAVLSTVGVTAFSKAQVKARDITRKNDLRQIQTALDLYYEAEHRYPGGNGPGETTADCYEINGTVHKSANIGNYLSFTPKDPKTQIPYCYKADPQGSYFVLWAKLENCDEANENIDRCKNGEDVYNYAISSNEAFLAQKSTPPTPNLITPREPSIVSPTAINRVDQSSCLIWINGDASADHLFVHARDAVYPLVIGSTSVAISSTLPGNFNLFIENMDERIPPPRESGFTKRDLYLYSTGGAVGDSVQIRAVSITTPTVSCTRRITINPPPTDCMRGLRGQAVIRVQTVLDTNFNPDSWPIYTTVGGSCLATNLPDTVFKKFTAFAGKMMSSVQDSLTSARQQPAVLGTDITSNTCRMDIVDGEWVVLGACGGSNRCLRYWCAQSTPNRPEAVCNTASIGEAKACGYEDPPRELGYCFSEICRFDTCGNDNDCRDSNMCTTNEKCDGFVTSPDDNKRRGLCSSTQVPANTVCAPSLNAPAASATMLCSGGTNSQCNVPYVQCAKASDNTANCCGTTNIQACRKSCGIDGLRSISDVNSKPEADGVAVWITDACNRQETYLTTNQNRGVIGKQVLGNTSYRIGYGFPGISTTRLYGARVTMSNSSISVDSFGAVVDSFGATIEANFSGLTTNAEGVAYYVGIGLN